MQDINIYQLLSFYAKKWYWVLLLTIIGAATGFIYNTYIQVPLYKSDATLLLVSSEDKKAGSTLINNYIALFKSRRVLEPVIAKQNNRIAYEELVASTTATNEKNTEVIKISIGTRDPSLSKALVDGVVVSFKNEVKELYKLENITVVDNANASTHPYNVNKAMQIALPTAIGLFTSLIILFFVYDMGFTRKKKSATKKNVVKTATKPKATAKKEVTPKKTALLKSATKTSKTAVSSEVRTVRKKSSPKKAKTTTHATSPKRKK